MIEFCNLTAGYNGVAVVQNVSFACNKGEVVAIIGKNGSGKSTLLKVATRQIPSISGAVFVNNKNINEFKQKELAKILGIMPQVRKVPCISAGNLVMHGRFPYLSFPRIPSAKDKQIVLQAMKDTNTFQFFDKNVSNLSGGERQRVYLAMLLAQQTDVVLLDEPATFLDMSCQFDLLDLIENLKNCNKAVLAVMHDIGQALSIADKIAVVSDNTIAFFGSPQQLMQSQGIQKFMGVFPHTAVDENGDIGYYFSRL